MLPCASAGVSGDGLMSQVWLRERAPSAAENKDTAAHHKTTRIHKEHRHVGKTLPCQAGRIDRGCIRGRRRSGDRDRGDRSRHSPQACRQHHHCGHHAVAERATAKHPGAKAVAARRIALALFRTSVQETGLSRVTVLKDLLNGETLAQIDGSKAPAVESAVMAKITTRLGKAETNGKITSAQESHAEAPRRKPASASS